MKHFLRILRENLNSANDNEYVYSTIPQEDNCI